MKRAPSREPCLRPSDAFKPRTGEHCFWMKSEISRLNCSPNFCGAASITTLADAERVHITATLRETNWVIGGPRGAAVQLGLPRTTLVARMQRLGIPNRTPRDPSGQATRRFA